MRLPSLVIVLSLLVFLPSSSFSLKEYINEQLNSLKSVVVHPKSYNHSLVDIGAGLGLTLALQHKKLAKNEGSKEWLEISQQLAQQDAFEAIALAKYYADNGNLNTAKLWLKPHHNDNKEVSLVYAQLLVEAGETERAYQLFKTHNTYSKQTLLLAIDMGDVAFLSSVLQSPNFDVKHAWFIELLQDINFFKLPKLKLPQKKVPSADLFYESYDQEQCARNVTYFATTLHDIERVRYLLESTASNPVGQIICPTEVRYMPTTWLECTSEPDKAIMCEESVFEMFQSQISSDYIALMLPKGGANVHQGILYFDRSDSIDVFVHELSHFAGFVDEYPLRQGHAVCQVTNQAVGLNVVVFEPQKKHYSRAEILSLLPWRDAIKPSTPLFVYEGNTQVLGTPQSHQEEVGLFKSETCDNNKNIAYKPIKQSSFMRYFELAIPVLYLELLEANHVENQRFFRPSFYSNLTQ